MADAANADVLLVFYRLAPEHPFPAALEGCVGSYEQLLDDGVAPDRIIIGGDSAGGNLALASLLALRDDATPLPAGAFAVSPCSDMSFSEGGARIEFGDPDALFPESAEARESDPGMLYAAGDQTVLDHPYASPVRRDLSGLCPVLLQVGSTDWLLDQSTLFAERARAASESLPDCIRQALAQPSRSDW